MRIKHLGILPIATLSAIILISPAYSGGLLGILDGNSDDSGSLVTLNSGPASNNGVVNVGLGGGGGNIADVNLGGGSNGGGSTVTANVSSGGGGSSGGGNGGGLLGGGLQVDVGLGPLDVNINLLGGGDDDGPGGNGNGNGGNINGGGNPNVIASRGSRGNDGAAQCLGEDPTALLNLFNTTRIDLSSWGRASNVTIVPIRLCPADRVQVADLLNRSGKGLQLQSAVASDALIATSLSRSSYGPNRVAAVKRRGSQILVYVY